ncbi:ATP-binding cassette sub-family G member 4 [Diachasma alloeum]|uniref:ATP-binding cassette sub-family G member 4 n=1 Tax=Diachasma alloeum TaxID=454923 RepID=UPI0007382FCF|nr:ATP-binding cassette sub-family G member 4 [Diachasma alloeum]
MEVLMHEASTGVSPIAQDNVTPGEISAPKIERVSEQKIQRNGSAGGWKGESQLLAKAKADHEVTDIVFENISYRVGLGLFRKDYKQILHGIHGRLPARQLIAIMGPSGAGKSTLLDILSGYRLTGISGNVYVNGQTRDLDAFRRSSAYITQDDRLQPLLTVIENMRVAADLKLGTNIPRQTKEQIIKEILVTLGLFDHQATRASRLSGGQQKRLSIALELVNNPTVMFLDEPTTGLDSSTCMQVVQLLKVLARQGRTIVCTIHQPSASLFQLFDQVLVVANGYCLYQGATDQLVPYLESVKLPCPIYHNPADYVIELACGEHGYDKIENLVNASDNGRNLQWFNNKERFVSSIEVAIDSSKGGEQTPDADEKRGKFDEEESEKSSILKKLRKKKSLQATSQLHQLKILLQRGFIKSKRDTTLTYLRLLVNIFTGIMLGTLFIGAGNQGHRVLENYNLLFAILMHHMMTSMMLTVLTFPSEMNILKKEHFNRWYSLKMFYVSVTIIDIPVAVICCAAFSGIIYVMSAQPMEWSRFSMFFTISMLVVFTAQSFGLVIGAVFSVVNGTFLAPTLSVPMMMFAGFGVNLRDLPGYLRPGSYLSYLRYGLEGYIHAIYGENRDTLDCAKTEEYCHYKYPKKFLNEIVAMAPDQFWNDVFGLTVLLLVLRISSYFLLRWKLQSAR